jgi:hypothetical protein
MRDGRLLPDVGQVVRLDIDDERPLRQHTDDLRRLRQAGDDGVAPLAGEQIVA